MSKPREKAGRTRTGKVATPFGYYGSKQALAGHMLRYLPEHHCWIELFGGSLALTMAKTPAPIEIVNDLDDEIVNVFEQLRNDSEELIRQIELTPYARVEHTRSRSPQPTDSGLERARKFLVQAMMSINGVVGGHQGGFSASNTYTREGREARVNRWRRYPDRLAAVIERLKDVRVEHQEAGKLLAKFADRPATAVYIDPPYLAERTNGYRVDAQCRDFHTALLEQAVKCSCMIMVSGYASRLYRETLGQVGKWRCVRLKTTTRGTNGKRHAREEVLWLNPPAEHALATGKVRIRLTPKEKNDQKVNPPRVKRHGMNYTRLEASEWPEIGNS